MMDAKISGKKFEENQDICIVSKNLPLPRYLLITKGRRVVIFTVEKQLRNPADTSLTK